MPYKDKQKQKEYQQQWVRQKRGSTTAKVRRGSTDIRPEQTGYDFATNKVIPPDKLPQIKRFTGPLTKERQVSQKGFNS